MNRTVRSLTSPLFSTLIARVLRENDGAGMRCYYENTDVALGRFRVDHSFQHHFDKFVDTLFERELSTNTISNYQSVVQHTLNHAFKKRWIDELPIRSFDIKRVFRDRVWTEQERRLIYCSMRWLRSHIYMSVYFAERNPIRGISDQFNLTWDNLVLDGLYAPYVRFRPRKTSKVKPRDTYLPDIDGELLEYFSWLKRTVPDCPFLFPRVVTNRNGRTWWKPMGCPKRHWGRVCTLAGVSDFRWHDLKHVAISNMLHARNSDGSPRYTPQDLKDLGIQYSDKAISVYLNLNAESVLSRINPRKLQNSGVVDAA